MGWFADTLRHYPELAVFLTLGFGALIGNAKLGSFSLGTVTGALFVGIAIGQLDIPVHSTTKAVLFLLFLFANGYAVGPQFVRGLQRDGVKPVVLTAFQAIVGLVVCVLFAKLLRLDPGLAAGLLSGALTQSPAMGTAAEAINALPLTETERARFVGHVAVGDGLTYVLGTTGAIWFLSRIAPKLLRIDLAAEARALENSLGMRSERLGILSAYRPFAIRAYRVENAAMENQLVGDLEAALEGKRVFVLRLRRGEEIVTVAETTRVQRGDIIAIGGRREWVLEVGPRIGSETVDAELLDFPVAAATVLVARKEVVGRTLGELVAMRELRAVGARRMTRLGEDIPILPGTKLESGDVIEIVGAEPDVERVAALLGRIVRPTHSTDLTVLGIAILIGAALGTLHLTAGKFNIGLGTSVGALVAGVVVGHFAARRPGFGYIPEAAVDLMRNIGLAAFVGMTGIQAGPHFIAAFKEIGIPLLLAGAVCTVVPLLCGVLFARHVLKMNPVLALGACAGAQTTTPSLAAIQEAAGSKIPVLGYTVPYAVGQIVLTLWGSAIVAIIA